ncbi:hypothetical protein Sp245p_24505 (plasmid) [Azospirillum baldaniorum]|uniref:Uncharacterized protein n=1 Tax=Azospirillum baldaniorum TaxID=1064539 RepID=A0A9P1NQV7_9PROT|nr:hypothetical protein Sp245p_24505 [Azospirillum baldaniorum]CCD02424.1 protein of unknown function [Azospirillum baldaniorum]
MTGAYGLQRVAKHHVPPAATAGAATNPANAQGCCHGDAFAKGCIEAQLRIHDRVVVLRQAETC